MKKLSLLIVAAMILTFGALAQTADAGGKGHARRHYAPRSYGWHSRNVYTHGYRGPSYGYYGYPRYRYYSYGNPHYGHRAVYLNFFGIPIITY